MLLSACATNPNAPKQGLGAQIKETFASDDPCSNRARNVGVVGGAIAGALAGYLLGDGKKGAVIGGGLVGGLVGGLIGSDMDRKRCELQKVAQQYKLDIRFAPIDAQGNVVTTKAGAAAAGPSPSGSAPSLPVATASEQGGDASAAADVSPSGPIVGSSLVVRNLDGASGHFESGSDQLTPRAREYFAAIARQYGAAQMLQGQNEPKQRDEILRQLKQRRLFLIGHTDDSGSSALNASLSERRAKSVAAFMRQQGISEDSLYYQGAGEALPIADNRSESGRAENRRVELVEIADEAAFKQYLAGRRPNYQFYRHQVDLPMAAAADKPARPAPAPVVPPLPAKPARPAQPPAAIGQSAAPATVTAQAQEGRAPGLDFGGLPYSRQEASLNLRSLPPTRTGFSLISTARADESVLLGDCTLDRPRATGTVRSLKDGSSYRTQEHLPQLYGKTWAADVNGHLLVLNRLAVLRDGAAPANLPELKVYGQYKPGSNKKPDVSEEPAVNTYLVNQGLLYRMFPSGEGGLRCVDVLFALDGSTSARGGKLIYGSAEARRVANVQPRMQ
ncbi:OmpA family protein [Paucibacter sp. B51]|uniref:OmpA family protein n=1 Tax=Paucibacter sp. B51 TaxID=2993315 RepID=UPI0022EBA835|nr:OmpA family protein [Paucibacter sp. B51]